MNLEASHLDQAERPRAAAMKFTYPSGSRPLDGYTIKRGIGRGGFGEVYFATSDAGKEVALKLIRRNLDVELRGVRQCLNLKHPNLIALYDIRSDEQDDQWVVMEYVSGESLEEVIDRHPHGLPEDEVLRWMRGIAAGVAYLHDHGIVHRDLKPGNIFSDEGMVKIGDYGLSKFISCSRRSGQTESVGTVHYMAPEIANGRYGKEIDIYALGIMLYEMLTGHVPFEGESVGEVLMKHLTAEPDLSRLEEPYRDIVRRALAKDPDQRLKSVGEMVALLAGRGHGAERAARRHNRIPRRGNTDCGATWPLRAAAANGLPPWHESAPGVIEEPIWKAIREGFAWLRHKWHSDDVQQTEPAEESAADLRFRRDLHFVCRHAVFALAVPAAICYGVYYVIWASVIRPGMSRHAQQQAEGPRSVHQSRLRTPEAATADWRAAEQPMSPAARYAQQVRRAAAAAELAGTGPRSRWRPSRGATSSPSCRGRCCWPRCLPHWRRWWRRCCWPSRPRRKMSRSTCGWRWSARWVAGRSWCPRSSSRARSRTRCRCGSCCWCWARLVGLAAWFLGDVLFLKMASLERAGGPQRGIALSRDAQLAAAGECRQSFAAALRSLLCVPVPAAAVVAAGGMHAEQPVEPVGRVCVRVLGVGAAAYFGGFRSRPA